MDFGRRDALAMIGVGLAGAAAEPSLASATAGKGQQGHAAMDYASPQGRLRAFMLMRGALDDRLVMSWVRGRYFGIVEDEVTPLFGVASCVFSRWRPAAGGGYEAATVEFAYFTDPVTDKVIDSFRNPYTGKDCAVPGGGYAPSKIVIGPDLSFRLAKERPGFAINHEVAPVIVAGDDVWLSERSATTAAIPGAPKPFRYTESVIYHAKRAALEAPGALQAPSEVSFNNVVSWRPWLGMDGHPGHLSAIGIGKQGATRESLPPAWVEATRVRHPELLADPAAVLAPLWNAG